MCSCGLSTFTANETCLEQELYRKDRYYTAALELYGNVTEIYPKSDIWVTGHSLGGVVSSLLGLKFQIPAVTFEAPPDSLPATRLSLYNPIDSNFTAPRNSQYRGAYHFGNTADPVYMGACNGATATCTLAGYAFESQCHTGLRCVYDTVEDFGWRQKIQHHSIEGVIKDVIEAYDTVPSCEPEPECVDCANWRFERINSSQSTTTSVTSTASTTTSLTRTSVCKTPGWWGGLTFGRQRKDILTCLGCRDESATTTLSSASTFTSTITTTTCVSWGWFGCNDPVQTTITTTIAPQSYPTSSFTITAAPKIP